jgi:hypothetical protein
MSFSDGEVLQAEDIPGRKFLYRSVEFSPGKDRPYSERESGDSCSARATRPILQ